MQRTVSTSIDLGLSGPVRLIYSVAVAQGAPISSESLEITVDGTAVEPTEIIDAHGTRLHSVQANGSNASLRYRAVVDGRGRRAPGQRHRRDRLPATEPLLRVRHHSPRRRLREFSGLSGLNLLNAVIDWVNRQLTYVSGSSLPTDGAVRTLLARQGVCRDFAHLSRRAAPLPERAGPARSGLRPRPQPDGVPRRRRGPGATVSGGSSTPPSWPRARACCGWPPAGTPPTPRSSPTSAANTTLTGLEVTAVVDQFELDNNQLLTQLR